MQQSTATLKHLCGDLNSVHIFIDNVPNKGQTQIMGTSGGEELLGARHHHEVGVLQIYM